MKSESGKWLRSSLRAAIAGSERWCHSLRSVTSFPFGEGHTGYFLFAVCAESERPSPWHLSWVLMVMAASRLR
jgi:hypothetical protein